MNHLTGDIRIKTSSLSVYNAKSSVNIIIIISIIIVVVAVTIIYNLLM